MIDGECIDIMFLSAQGALLLSEVLRERDAQLEYKKRKQEAAKTADLKYIRIQEEVHVVHVYTCLFMYSSVCVVL